MEEPPLWVFVGDFFRQWEKEAKEALSETELYLVCKHLRWIKLRKITLKNGIRVVSMKNLHKSELCKPWGGLRLPDK